MENILNLVNDRLRMNEMSVSGKIVGIILHGRKNAEQTTFFVGNCFRTLTELKCAELTG